MAVVVMREEAVKNLYNAAAGGDIETLKQMLEQDPYLVDIASFTCSRNIVHIATMKGQAAIVSELLHRNPQLAHDSDSQKRSYLHMAAALGHIDIVSKLVAVAPEMCWSRDGQGMNTVHVAAAKGHAKTLEMLVGLDQWAAKERVNGGKTASHLCVQHGHLEALKVLVDKVGDLARAADDDGETVLHLAVRYKNVQMIEYLVESKKVDKNARNSKGKTAIQIFYENFSHETSSEMRTIRYALSPILIIAPDEFLKKWSEVAMVAAVLIATMAYQSTVTPPGGVWQDDSKSHRAGEAVLASTRPHLYKNLVRANTTAIVSSLIVIFVHSTGVPSDNLLLMNVVMFGMLMSLSSTAVSFGASAIAVTPKVGNQKQNYSLEFVVVMVVVVSVCVAGIGYVLTYLWLWRYWITRFCVHFNLMPKRPVH